MHLLFVLVTVVFLPSTTSGDSGVCGGSNSTCQTACLKQPCDTDWSCNGTLLNTCRQSCYHNACTRLSCDENVQKCQQFCFGCQLMSCNSSQCDQRCHAGDCDHITCKATQDCQQICAHCRRLRCHDSKNCAQTCLKSNCSLECLQSQVCRQNCLGDGCLANCNGNRDCFQTCQGNCTQLICDSKFCSQKCENNSQCDILRCHGEHCKQETFVEKSKLECTSNLCQDQISHASNTVLSCANNNGTCKQKCLGGGCTMTCGKHVKSCEQYCDGGYCNMSCARGVESCTMECHGRNCTFSCEAQHCSLLCENSECEGNDEEDNREKCDNSASKLSVLFLLLISFISLSLVC